MAEIPVVNPGANPHVPSAHKPLHPSGQGIVPERCVTITYRYTNHLLFNFVLYGLLVLLLELLWLLLHLLPSSLIPTWVANTRAGVVPVGVIVVVLCLAVVLSVMFAIAFQITSVILDKSATMVLNSGQAVVTQGKKQWVFPYHHITHIEKTLLTSVYGLDPSRSAKIIGPYYTKYTVTAGGKKVSFYSSVKEGWQTVGMKGMLICGPKNTGYTIDQAFYALNERCRFQGFL